MKLNLKNVNCLPTPTWNKLGVNGGIIDTEIPEIVPYTADVFPQTLPKGVEISDVMKTDIVFMDGDVDTGSGDSVREFVKKNHNTGFFIEIKAGTKVEEPIFLNLELDNQNPTLVDENTIVAEPGSNVTVVMRYTSKPGFNGFHAGMTRIYAKNDATVTLVQVQSLNETSLHFDDVGGTVFENGHVNLVQTEIGGSHASAAAHLKLMGRQSGVNIGNIYLGGNEESIDINYLVDHYGQKTDCEILARGALQDKSQKIFRGTIDFKRGSAGSKGREEEFAVLLDPTVRARSAPLILCEEEDVDGQHAASIGRIDENRLFYLMSRGLTEAEARKLIIEAQFTPILSRIPIASVREDLQTSIAGRLNTHG